jgi:pimeloyl-ACP methyl ester carboxylesterase
MIMDRTAIDTSIKRQTVLDVTAPDGKKIFVYCNRAGDTPSPKAVVIGHGLGDSPNGYMHMMARDFFTSKGYDVYRMAFYWDEPEYRILHDCTLDIHGQDLNTVINHVRNHHQKIFVCGHSYGGLTLVFANPQVNALSFWDPSYQPYDRFWKTSAAPNHDGKTYLLRWEYLITIGKDMIDEAKALSRPRAKDLISRISIPSQVIIAGDSWLKDDATMLFDDLVCQKECVEIQGAGHTFVEGLVVFDLLDKTHQWFERV